MILPPDGPGERRAARQGEAAKIQAIGGVSLANFIPFPGSPATLSRREKGAKLEDPRLVFAVSSLEPLNLKLSHAPVRRPRLRACALLAAVLAGLAGARGQTRLSEASPFLPGPGSATGGAAGQDGYELTGASTTATSSDVCIYDSLHRRSHWIRVGGTADGIQVLSYDARRSVVRVRVNGASKELTQRKAAVVAGVALPPVQPIAAAAPAADNSSPANAAPAPNPAEAGKSPEIVKQERDARMLVSDLLEIGIQQRKAYEEAQKKAGNGS